MTGPILIDFAGMGRLVDALGDATGRIASLLARLDAEVSTLNYEWAGEAAEAYLSAHGKWMASISEMNRVLQSAHASAATITDRHRAVDRSVQDLWS